MMKYLGIQVEIVVSGSTNLAQVSLSKGLLCLQKKLRMKIKQNSPEWLLNRHNQKNKRLHQLNNSLTKLNSKLSHLNLLS
jgi:hypothetical protein